MGKKRKKFFVPVTPYFLSSKLNAPDSLDVLRKVPASWLFWLPFFAPIHQYNILFEIQQPEIYIVFQMHLCHCFILFPFLLIPSYRCYLFFTVAAYWGNIFIELSITIQKSLCRSVTYANGRVALWQWYCQMQGAWRRFFKESCKMAALEGWSLENSGLCENCAPLISLGIQLILFVFW